MAQGEFGRPLRATLTALSLGLAVVLGLTACPSGARRAPGTADATVLSGQAIFPPTFRTRVGIGDIAGAATVSLIDPRANVTVGTTLTDASGGFSFNFGLGFVPRPDPYILEAVKGLAGHRPGNPAARVRTVIRFRNGIWSSLTGDGSVVISRATTALSILAALRGLDYETLLGTVSTGQPATFNDAGTGTTVAEFDQVLKLIGDALDADRDPVEAILWNPVRGFFLKEGSGALKVLILEIYPQPAGAGGTVTIVGTNIGEAGLTNLVKFPTEATASLTAIGSNSIVVRIPENALSGLLFLSNPFGDATANVAIVGTMAGVFGPAGGAAVPEPNPGDSPQPSLVGGFSPDGEYRRGYSDPARTPGPTPAGAIPDLSGDVDPRGSGGSVSGPPAPVLTGGFDPGPTPAP